MAAPLTQSDLEAFADEFSEDLGPLIREVIARSTAPFATQIEALSKRISALEARDHDAAAADAIEGRT